MSARTRRILTAVSAVYLATVAYLLSVLPISPALNLLLATAAVPLVWLIWALARASAYQHANREARAVDKVMAGSARPLPHQEVAR